MRGWWILGLVLCSLLLIGVAVAEVGKGRRAQQQAQSGDREFHLQVGGRDRWYLVHTPAGASKGPLPVVFAFHGGGGGPEGMASMSNLSAFADQHGFLVVYPAGTGPIPGARKLLTWNSGGCCGYAMKNSVDDMAFVRAAVAQVEQDYAVDPLRIYATGMSNGGGMSYRLACEASDLFAAVAPISAAPSQRSECSSATAISILAMHGSADQHVPLNGGYGAKSLQPRDDPAFREYLQGWATRLKCGDAPTESEDGLLTRLDWSNPQTGVEVRGIIIDGAGHQWPGGAPGWRGGDEPSMAIDANATMWEFFQRHPKP